MKLRYLCHVLLLWVLLNPSGNNVDAAQIEGCGPVTISGEIDKQTPAVLQRLLDSCKMAQTPRLSVVYLDSPGGDLDAAMQVGRIVRRWQVTAIVDREAQCASACVLVLLGGVQRLVTGNIGLHRPYSTDTSSSSDEATKKYRSMRGKLQSYLREMNIPDRLLDAMNAVSPQQTRWLSGERDEKELEELWIQGKDPAWEDLKLSEKAQKLGISKQELIKRAQLAAQCRNIHLDQDEKKSNKWLLKRRFECHDAIIEGGLSMQEFLKRSQLAEAQCAVFSEMLEQNESVSKRNMCRYWILEKGRYP